MTKAFFDYKTRSGQRFVCTVILKNDGKVSISLPMMNKYTSPAERYSAKLLANEIVKAKFVHPAVVSVIKENNHKLIELLTKKTQKLKKAFIEKTEKFAIARYKEAKKLTKLSTEQLVEIYGEATIVPQKLIQQSWLFAESPLKRKPILSARGKDAVSKAKDLVAKGRDKFIAEEIKNAELHYENSVEKLASRLNQKGVTSDENIEIISSMLGVNFDMVINHNNIVTRAWTIIAEGPVQRPHYRFLVK